MGCATCLEHAPRSAFNLICLCRAHPIGLRGLLTAWRLRQSVFARLNQCIQARVRGVGTSNDASGRALSKFVRSAVWPALANSVERHLHGSHRSAVIVPCDHCRNSATNRCRISPSRKQPLWAVANLDVRASNARWRNMATRFALPDITWTSTSMSLRITDAPPPAATNEIACGYVRHRNVRRGKCYASRPALESWLSLERSCTLASRPACYRNDQRQETNAAH